MPLAAALRLNAYFSLGTGILLAAAPGTVGAWLDVSVDGFLRALGIALIGHAALLVWAGRRPTVASWAKLNIAVIAPYPLIMIGLLTAGFVDNALGGALLLLDGSIVGSLAFAQLVGVRAFADTAHPAPA